MLLQKLREYNQRVGRTPVMYVPTPIRWLIDVDDQGHLRGFVQLEGERARGKRGKEFLAPHAGRSSRIIPKLLADRADYALGVFPVDSDARAQRHTAERHQAFVDLVRECAEATREQAVRAVFQFLERVDLNSIALPTDLAPGDAVTFRVGELLPIDLPAVREFWARRHEREVAEAGGGETECLVCGRRRPPATRHRVKIKRIPGGQQSGMTLVSANADAFESYGLRASLVAPICAECAEDYAQAANRLIADDRTHLVIGPLMYLFWTRDGTEVPPLSRLLRNPQPDDVKELLRAPWTGREGAASLDRGAFYAVALGASGGRVAVRDWIETTVEVVRGNLERYFRLQRIVEWDGSEGAPIGLFPLVASLAARADDLPPQVPRALVRLALARSPLPRSLLAQAVGRVRAEQAVTRPRAAVIKMSLLSANLEEDETMEQLSPDFRHPAYLCGRVFAIVEEIQRAALGDVNATVADRFFGAASTSPAYVLGKLVGDAKKSHMGKLRRDKPGAYAALSRRLEEAMEGLAAFPATLTLEDQGRFVLGYYHQLAADRSAARQRRNEGEWARVAAGGAGVDEKKGGHDEPNPH